MGKINIIDAQRNVTRKNTRIVGILKEVRFCIATFCFMGTAVAQLVEALRYKSEGRGLDSRWCHWNFSLT